MTTDEPLAVVSVLPVWKIQTAFGSPWAAMTLAGLVKKPGSVGVTASVTVAAAPGARLPSAQMTVPAPVQLP